MVLVLAVAIIVTGVRGRLHFFIFILHTNNIPSKNRQYNWIICVLASPILETQTKLWLIFNVAHRRYTTLPLGYPPSYAKKLKMEKEKEKQALV